MKNPEISIVIPAYNEERVIGSVIKGIFDVALRECEIIVIDDGSSDGTANNRISRNVG